MTTRTEGLKAGGPAATATARSEGMSVTPPVEPNAIRRKALLRFAISISVLTIVGHAVLGFEQAPIVPVATIAVSYAVSLLLEWLDSWARGRRPDYSGGRTNMFYFLLPAHISALACALLLYADNLGPYLFAAAAAAGSKYVFRITVKGRSRHYLNPSNFGIAITLLTMPLVGFVPPYQFLNNIDQPWDWAVPLGILMAGTMLNAKLTRKLPLILGWVGGYVLQAVARTVFFGDSLAATLGMMTGVAFILFTNYMITDPGTTPVKRGRQVCFGLGAAAVYGTLVVSGVSYAIFFALTIVCAIRGAVMYVAARRAAAAAAAATPRVSKGSPALAPVELARV